MISWVILFHPLSSVVFVSVLITEDFTWHLNSSNSTHQEATRSPQIQTKGFPACAKQPAVAPFLMITHRQQKYEEGAPTVSHLLFLSQAATDLLTPGDLSLHQQSVPSMVRAGPPWTETLQGSQIVVSIKSPTQRPKLAGSWPLGLERHTLVMSKSKTQWDTWLPVQLLWASVILSELLSYCPSAKITPSLASVDVTWLQLQWVNPACFVFPDVWLWVCSTAGSEPRFPWHIPQRQLGLWFSSDSGNHRKWTHFRWAIPVLHRPIKLFNPWSV